MDKETLVEFSELEGEILTSVEEGTSTHANWCDEAEFMLTFKTQSGREFRMYHGRDCCEDVTLQEVSGSWDDIIGYEIYLAEKRTSDIEVGKYGEESMWTFYTIRTTMGTVDLRWLGSSNGYYSVEVSFYEVGMRVCSECKRLLDK